jgi:hypothetical protein
VKTVIFPLLALCALGPALQDRSTAPPPPREATERGALAVLRRDGIMFPFASFERDSWKLTWPIETHLPRVPLALDDVPSKWWGTRTPELWHAYLFSGEMRPIKMRAPVMYPIFCSRRIGLQTTYEPSVPPPLRMGNDPFPKDGVVVSGYARIAPIEALSPSSAEWKPFEAALVDAFDDVEAKTIDGVRNNTGWRHPFGKDERNKIPIRLEAWYRSPGDNPDWTISYIEAVRQYPARPEDKGCGIETLVSGWVQHFKGTMTLPELRGKVTYCDRVGATYMLPLGRIRPHERSYWIYQLSGWEEEWYQVARIEPGTVRHVIEVFAGGKGACR